MGPEEVRVGRREFGEDREKRRLFGSGDGWEGVEHGVHEREGLRLGVEVECGEERDGCAEGRKPDLRVVSASNPEADCGEWGRLGVNVLRRAAISESDDAASMELRPVGHEVYRGRQNEE